MICKLHLTEINRDNQMQEKSVRDSNKKKSVFQNAQSLFLLKTNHNGGKYEHANYEMFTDFTQSCVDSKLNMLYQFQTKIVTE